MSLRAPASTLLCLVLLALPATALAKVYGKKPAGKATVQISELIDHPDEYVGETVRVKGRVIGVCERRGCWMELASDREFESMRIKVDDGVIVFPMAAKGKMAVAEGVFTKIELTLEQTRKWRQHQAEEEGKKCDVSQIHEADVFYQIAGTGARVR